MVEKFGTPGFDTTFSGSVRSKVPETVNEFYESYLPRLATYEFSRDRKSMSVLANNNGSPVLLVKGAPESILERCNTARSGTEGVKILLDSSARRLVQQKLDEYANAGLRVMAFATVENITGHPLIGKANTTQHYLELEQNMTFLGLVAMLDPPRPEVKESIRKCRAAGIRIIVITGDNKRTAETICRQIGVFGEDEDLTGKSYTGREFDELSEEEKLEAAKRASLFSRTEPAHKSKLVDLLQHAGEVVAMTGDGVNDAPALKKADIGVAMGSGTDVAKLAADMVLIDDNFATIELAIEEGRTIFCAAVYSLSHLVQHW